MENNSFDFAKIFLLIVAVIVILTIPFLFMVGKGGAATILIFVFGVVAIPVIMIYRQYSEEDEDQEESEETNIDGKWYTDHYMEKIQEAYNIQNEDKDEDNDEEADIEIESYSPIREPQFTSSSPNYQSPVFFDESEENENYKKTLNNVSLILTIIAVLWFGVLNFFPSETDRAINLLNIDSMLSFGIKIFPAILLAASRLFSILTIKMEKEGFTLDYLRPIFLIIICFGYIINEFLQYSQ